MEGAAGLLLNSSVKFIGWLSGFLNSKHALNDGTTSSRKMLELFFGRKRSVAFWTLVIIVVASFWICRLGLEVSRVQRRSRHRLTP